MELFVTNLLCDGAVSSETMSATVNMACRYKDRCDRCGLDMQSLRHSWCTSQKCYCSDACYLGTS
jgi:hypothetical protein